MNYYDSFEIEQMSTSSDHKITLDTQIKTEISWNHLPQKLIGK